MKISKEARKVSRALFQESLKDGRLDQTRVSAAARKIAESKPRNYINILESFERLVRLELAKRHAVIESAAELDQSTRGQLETTLRAKYGQDVTTEFKVVPELIGGMRVKVGSDVFDSSVRERLDRLENSLLHA
jgi:F-type H+-transporting ATPase subunit delta